MISKQYFEETFSLATARELQAWADNNLISTARGDYAMTISYVGAGAMFAETEVTGLTPGNEYILKTDTVDVLSNAYRTKVNTVANDNSSMIAEMGYTASGVRSLTFTATTETVYIAIGDEVGAATTFSTVDNISLKVDGVEGIANGTFEGNITTPWYPQNGNSSLSVYQYAVEPPVGDNPYLEDVNIPAYDSGNPKHFIISSNADWAEINNSAYTNFYVEAGDYTALGLISLTTDGTAVNPRTISLHNGNDTHPAQLTEIESAQYMLSFASDYWTVDRPTMYGHPTGENWWYRFQSNSSHCIVNRLYKTGGNKAIRIQQDANNLTIQKSFVDSRESTGDMASIELWGSETSAWGCANIKVISNDFKNQCDVLQIVDNGTTKQSINCEGMVIYDNNMWIDDTIYTDGSGNLDPNGVTAFAEGALDFKGGSTVVDNPVLVQKNNFWGWREADSSGDLSSRGSSGTHFGAFNVHFLENVFFDSSAGIHSGDPRNFQYDFENGKINDNIFSDCGSIPDGVRGAYSISVTQSDNVEVNGNWIINPRDGQGTNIDSYSRFVLSNDSDFTDNFVVNANTDTFRIRDCTNCVDVNTTYYADEATAGLTEDYTFYYERYTSTPQLMTLANVLRP